MKQVKCEHCGRWTNGNASHCEHCGGRLQEAYHTEREERKERDKGIELVEVNPDDPWHRRTHKKITRYGQFVFLILLSILATIVAITVH